VFRHPGSTFERTKNMRRDISLFVVGSVAVLVLVGCTPPMPEALRVELAERTVQCGDGFVDAKFLPEMLDVGDFWNSSMDVACEGAMGLLVSDQYPQGPGLVITEEVVTGCTPYAAVPVAVDAAVFTFYFEEIYEVNLSPQILSGIISGSITDWSDPAIQAINPAVEFPDLPINLIASAPSGAILAMGIWLSSEVGASVDMSSFSPSISSEVDALYELSEGDLKLTSFAALQLAAANYANMVLDESNLESVVLPDVLTIQTGIGQTKLTGEGAFLSFEYDPSIPAQPLPGQFEAIEPWGALYPVTMYLCGSDELQTRFVARFLLRLDAQGSISTGVFNPLLESIRVAAISVVAEGLPEVEIPEELIKELEG
jgi:hypothetical protein